jgi:hypothetical protein
LELVPNRRPTTHPQPLAPKNRLMKKLYILITIITLSSLSDVTYCQDSLKNNDYKNALSIEVLGNGITFSFNYERILFRKNIYCLSSRNGISYLPKFNGDLHGPGFIFELNNSFGKSKNKIELGIGLNALYLIEELEESIFVNDKFLKLIFIYTSPRIGYKLESKKGHFFRIGVTPVIGLSYHVINTNFSSTMKNETIARPWLGIGFGKVF